MSVRRLTNQEQLRKMLKEAMPGSVLQAELSAVQVAIIKPRRQGVTDLIKLLKSSTQRETQWFIGKVFGTAKDERVIRPLMKAAQDPANENYQTRFLWPLEHYDCTQHLNFFVDFMLKCEDPSESMLACFYVIAAMKGPFEATVVKRNIRKLLRPTPPLPEQDMALQSEHFKMSAADYLMSAYFLQIGRQYHKKPTTT